MIRKSVEMDSHRGLVTGASSAVANHKEGSSGARSEGNMINPREDRRGLGSDRIQHALQEILRTRMLWLIQDVCRFAFLNDDTMVKKEHTVGHFACEFHLMRD